MNFETIIFYLFAAILVFAAARVVTARNPVHSALFLVLAFFTAAALWITLEAEFLAITLVLVYVGAVMVLFLFVVMMLDINYDLLREGFWENFPYALTVAILMGAEMVLVLAGRNFWANGNGGMPNAHGAGYSNIKELGRLIYTDYVYPFEIASVILLVAIVAAIALTLRHRKDTKYQDPAAQIAVRRNDRLRIIAVSSDNKLKQQAAEDSPSAEQP
ncbi:NADH dehydrogenase subunit J [Sulfurimicrobium lacus]|uniref:NADH-quinone oxidoreductase subunit J n=1 Tax=Sulfurimicrobium lacus TaxID=2715678 RepID=A0A6F8V8Z7_9PROT|nr:NADH-quinone oxidoreductase subunit J [Sulfurimicrobium lacus]BCB25790.1 NADH dehydrogenase subunit J [Sulfurimicrobium lacus]